MGDTEGMGDTRMGDTKTRNTNTGTRPRGTRAVCGVRGGDHETPPPRPRLVPRPHLELVELQQVAIEEGGRADGAEQPALLRAPLRQHAVGALAG